ncbi:MAG: magnesium/cobalt transporter CorA [Vicinamibacterales bacterium]
MTRPVERVDPAWLDPASKAIVWVDLVHPTPEEGQQILAGVFHLHPLAIEDALSEIHHPKIEPYEGYLYLILHGIDYHRGERNFATRDVDFFVGRNYLVTAHDGHSRSIADVKATCERRDDVMAEGPIALLHRIVDRMVDNYRPEIDRLEEEIDEVENLAIVGYRKDVVRQILSLKRDLAGLRRVVLPQRDLVGRLARREFPQITDELTYRFRDVHDNLVRLSDEATLFQDRVTSILEAHLSAISNRLNEVMKVLTVMSTIFLPLTVLTGIWGMNVPLPVLPGGEAAQFWWIAAAMAAITVSMLAFFHRRGWI